MLGGHDLGGRIDFAQADLDSLPGVLVDPVGFVEENQVGVTNLLLLHGPSPP